MLELYYCAELLYGDSHILATGYSEVHNIAELIDQIKTKYPEHKFLRVQYTLWNGYNDFKRNH